jgi:hypothetical protein
VSGLKLAYDPELAPVAAGEPLLDLADYVRTRRAVRQLPDDLPPEIGWTDVRADVGAGHAVDVRVRCVARRGRDSTV